MAKQGTPDKQERLAQALRKNLARRKHQARNQTQKPQDTASDADEEKQ